MLDIPSREGTSAKRSVDIVQVKRILRSIPVKFKPGTRKSFEKASVVVNADYDSSTVFRDLSHDIRVDEDEIIEKDAS